VAIVTRVLIEQSGIWVRLLAGAHICLRRIAKELVVGPTERPMPFTPDKIYHSSKPTSHPSSVLRLRMSSAGSRRSGARLFCLYLFLSR